MINQKSTMTLSEIRHILINMFTFDELQLIALELDIDIDSLPGEGKSAKVRELITFVDRRKRLSDLINIIRKERPSLTLPITSPNDDKNPSRNDIDNLSVEITSLRQQILELQEGSMTNNQIEQKINNLLKTANRAVGRSEELTARIVLPRQEHMNVQLVPSHSLERLDEYRSDENIIYLMIGIFAGSILGILSNWVTNENFIITRFSVILMGIVFVLTILCIIWAIIIRKRADIVKRRIFEPHTDTDRKE